VNETIRVYVQLAEEHQKRDRAQERDRFLLLAADAAHAAGDPQLAEEMRRRILKQNPSHLLKPYGSFAEALQSLDLQAYVQQLREKYPPKKAERLLEELRPKAESGGRVSQLDEEFALPLDADRGGSGQRTTAPLSAASAQALKETQKVNIPPLAGSDRPAGMQPIPFKKSEETPAARPAPQEGGVARPARPRSAPPPHRTTPPATRRARFEREETQAGAWVGSILFVVTLIAGLALLASVFDLPFVQLPL
jgi:hypothetical protein